MATALSEAQITQQLGKLDGWERDGGTITKTFKLDTYLAGVALASAVGVICEARNHHPDMTIGWRKVTVSFTTHDAGSQLTEADFDAAAAIDALGYPKTGG